MQSIKNSKCLDCREGENQEERKCDVEMKQDLSQREAPEASVPVMTDLCQA